MTIYDIKKCFDSYLSTYSTDNSINVSWEGVSFTPVEGETFLDPHFLNSTPYQRELIGANTKTRCSGFYQINVVTKAGTGMNTMYEQYEGLQAIFGRGTGLTYTNGDGDSLLVEINRYYMGQLDESDDALMFIPISIEWRSDILIS